MPPELLSGTMTPAELLQHCTARIACTHTDGSGSTGTGFFFDLPVRGGDYVVQCLVTNRHVVRGAQGGTVTLTMANPDGTPQAGRFFTLSVGNFEQAWLGHPDPSVDLCILPIKTLLDEAAKQGLRGFFGALSANLIPVIEDVEEFDAIEEVVMVGYPIGLWDEHNNLPILRSGITASHPAKDFKGRKELVVDVASFPGSSGSPVFLFDRDIRRTRGGALQAETRNKLLGILYAGPMYTAQGDVVVVEVPTALKGFANTLIPTNLGFVIKSSRLLEFQPLFDLKV